MFKKGLKKRMLENQNMHSRNAKTLSFESAESCPE